MACRIWPSVLPKVLNTRGSFMLLRRTRHHLQVVQLRSCAMRWLRLAGDERGRRGSTRSAATSCWLSASRDAAPSPPRAALAAAARSCSLSSCVTGTLPGGHSRTQPLCRLHRPQHARQTAALQVPVRSRPPLTVEMVAQTRRHEVGWRSSGSPCTHRSRHTFRAIIDPPVDAGLPPGQGLQLGDAKLQPGLRTARWQIELHADQ